MAGAAEDRGQLFEMSDGTSLRVPLAVIVLLAAACQGSTATTTESPTITTSEVVTSTTTPATTTSAHTTTTPTPPAETDGPLTLLAAGPVVTPFGDERYANPGLGGRARRCLAHVPQLLLGVARSV